MKWLKPTRASRFAYADLGARCGCVPRQICGGFSPARDLQLRQNRRHVVLDSLLRQLQLFANLAVRKAVRNEREDPFLLRGQPRELLVAHGFALAKALKDGSRHFGVEEASACAHLSDCPDQLAAADLFEDVAGGAG